MIVDYHFAVLPRNWIVIIHQSRFYSKIIKKTGNDHQKEGCSHKKKTAASQDAKIVREAKQQCTATS